MKGTGEHEFDNEAALCAAFVRWVQAPAPRWRHHHPDDDARWTVYPETGGFDLLLVDGSGRQLGIEAKRSLNAKVLVQAFPDHYSGMERGPDWRGVLVPRVSSELTTIAVHLGLVVFAPRPGHGEDGIIEFSPGIGAGGGFAQSERLDAERWALQCARPWFDWNPAKRLELPEFVPSVAAGVPSPIRLTAWKIGALRVLARLEVRGTITAAEVRDCGVDARRFCATDGWLQQATPRGHWSRGRVPAFDLQHPTEFAELVRRARAELDAEASKSEAA